MCLLLYFLLMNEYSIERLEPILSTSLDRITISNLLPLGVYGDILLFGAFCTPAASRVSCLPP